MGYFLRPHRLGEDACRIREAVSWLQATDRVDRPVIATNIWVSYFLDRGQTVVVPDGTPVLDTAEVGSILVWDAEYAPTGRFGLTVPVLEDRADWQLIWTGSADPDAEPFVRVYERNGRIPSPAESPALQD
jgi:hypothetical protein